MRIGEKIHRIRRERGHTAEQFAETLGISTVSLRKYEYGERTPKEPMITEIERCLKVNPHLSSPTGKRRERCDSYAVRAGGSVLPGANQSRGHCGFGSSGRHG